MKHRKGRKVLDRNLSSPVEGFEVYRKFLIFVGSVLVLAGVALLVLCAKIVFDVLNDPNSVPVFQYLMTLFSVDRPVIEGTMAVMTPHGKQDMDFSVRISPEMKSIMFLVVGAFITVLMATVVKMIIDGGVAITKGGLYTGAPKKGGK